jgi:[ribosomal protein S5]-alanine N-acetyltransferase
MTTNFPFIKTDRLLLRRFSDFDMENVFKGLSNPDIIKYYGVRYDTLESTQEQMKWFAELEGTGTGLWRAVCSNDNKTFYGACGLNNLNNMHKKAEIGFWLLPQFWSQGIMTEAIPLIYNYGFEQLHLHRIEAQVETENIKSKKLLEKLDFRYEGTLRDCEIKDGKFISLDIYAKLKS